MIELSLPFVKFFKDVLKIRNLNFGFASNFGFGASNFKFLKGVI
jgi:hypothetical protein